MLKELFPLFLSVNLELSSLSVPDPLMHDKLKDPWLLPFAETMLPNNCITYNLLCPSAQDHL